MNRVTLPGFLAASISLASCVSSVPVRSSPVCAPEDSAARWYVSRWTTLAREEGFWVAHVASQFVQQALRSERIANLAAGCVSITDAERVLYIEVGLVLRLLALGLAHFDEPSFHDAALRLMALAAIETDGDIGCALDRVVSLEGNSEQAQSGGLDTRLCAVLVSRCRKRGRTSDGRTSTSVRLV